MADLAAARAAKHQLVDSLSGQPRLGSIGIGHGDGGYHLVVGVDDDSQLARVPTEVAGVPVLARVTGAVRPLLAPDGFHPPADALGGHPAG